jgi:hypothetical protein
MKANEEYNCFKIHKENWHIAYFKEIGGSPYSAYFVSCVG